MGERFEKTLWYLVAAIAIYNITPLVCALSNFPLYNLLPPLYICAVLIISFMFGRRHGGDWLISFGLAAAFIPTIYMFFNPTVWIYVPVYLVAGFIGDVIGSVFGKRFGR